MRSPQPEQIYYYYPDGQGSTSYIANSSALLLEKYSYDLAGKPTVTTFGTTGPYNVDMLFTGQKWYSGYGILDLRHRAYLAGLGRFLQPDPVGFAGDPANIYRYCGNNPVNWSDPSGLFNMGEIASGVFNLGAGSVELGILGLADVGTGGAATPLVIVAAIGAGTQTVAGYSYLMHGIFGNDSGPPISDVPMDPVQGFARVHSLDAQNMVKRVEGTISMGVGFRGFGLAPDELIETLRNMNNFGSGAYELLSQLLS